MLHARSSSRRCGPYGYIGSSQTMAYLSSCGYPPVPSSLASAVSVQTGPPVIYRTLSPSPTHTVLHSFSLSLPSPIGHSILSRTKETVAVTENEERQLDGHGLEIVLHLFTRNTVCTPFLSVSSFLSFALSSPFLVSFDTLTFFHFLLCSWFLFSVLFPPLSPNSGCRSFDFLHHIPLLLPLSLSRSAVAFFLFVSVCSHSTMWSEPLQWIISQLTRRGQPKPPVQT